MAQKVLRRFKCPSCSEMSSLRISRARNSREKLILLIPFVEIYRCRKCGWRGWKFNLFLDQMYVKKSIVYIFLIIITAIIVYNLLKMVV